MFSMRKHPSQIALVTLLAFALGQPQSFYSPLKPDTLRPTIENPALQSGLEENLKRKEHVTSSIGLEEPRLINSRQVRPEVRQAIVEFVHGTSAMEAYGPLNQRIHLPIDSIWSRTKNLTEIEQLLLSWTQFRYAVLDQYHERQSWKREYTIGRYPTEYEIGNYPVEYEIGFAIQELKKLRESPVWNQKDAAPKDRVLFLLDLAFAYRTHGEFPDEPFKELGKKTVFRKNTQDLGQALLYLGQAERVAKHSAADLLSQIEQQKKEIRALLGRHAAGLEELGRPETPSSRRAVIFGMGNIGRGHIAALLAPDDFDLIFADINPALIAEANSRDSYTVTPVGSGEPVTVKNFWGIAATDMEKIAAQGAKADWIFTSVGTNNIIRLKEVTYRYIRKRIEANHLQTLNIVFAENLPVDQPQIKALKEAVLAMAEDAQTRAYVENRVNFIGAESFADYVNNDVGWVGAVVSITVPPTIATASDNPLDIQVEGGGPYYLEVDKRELKNTEFIPSGFRPVENIRAAREKKLLIHNMGHAALAYLCSALGIADPAEGMRNPKIAQIVQRAMQESAQGLNHRYPDLFPLPMLEEYIQGLLQRFGNAELHDTVKRIGQDPMRKLQENDRLFGAAISALEAPVSPDAIQLAIAAAIRYAREVEKVSDETLAPVMELVQKYHLQLPENAAAFQESITRLSAGGLEESQLRLIRTRLDLSQEQLRQQLAQMGYNNGQPVSKSAVSRWETGMRPIPEDVLDILLRLSPITTGLEERNEDEILAQAAEAVQGDGVLVVGPEVSQLAYPVLEELAAYKNFNDRMIFFNIDPKWARRLRTLNYRTRIMEGHLTGLIQVLLSKPEADRVSVIGVELAQRLAEDLQKRGIASITIFALQADPMLQPLLFSAGVRQEVLRQIDADGLDDPIRRRAA